MKQFIHQPNQIKNSSLYYDKFVFSEKRLMEKDNTISDEINRVLNGDTRNENIKNNRNKLKRDLASRKIDDVLERQIKERYKDILINIATRELKEKIELAKRLRINMIKSLKNRYRILSYEIYTKTPFLIGAGIPSIDEVGFYWSRNLGLPIIPGTTLKGAFRKFLELKNSTFIDSIFGKEDNKGDAIFLDTIPIDNIELGKEFQAPHFQNYYSKNKAPNDIYNPVPINYLSVFKGKFRLDIIIEKNNDEIFKEIESNIKEFLEFYGLGAKTSMGYGRFNISRQL
ncbi:hypothetical protein AS160_04435 [Marinitoga sp. 38H-ov]|nr:type III-B CRISPR module RAMP protein Cmr6 [Marinitoga sp. 38H-ov]KAF2956647.1 hypothetical protein AS160_04435 [Marinitoga sp. 38H-ov]